MQPVSGSQAGVPTNVAHPHPAPLFELPGPDGKLFKLESLKGNAVIVHFWASWCPPCLGEIPHWLEFASQWKSKPVKFVAVSLDQGWPEALKILPVSQLPENVSSVLDHDQKLPDLFGTYQYPETYLLDRGSSDRFEVGRCATMGVAPRSNRRFRRCCLAVSFFCESWLPLLLEETARKRSVLAGISGPSLRAWSRPKG